MKIIIKNIRKSYGKRVVLDAASFEAVSGECIGIIGVNGSGKSTLLEILAGIRNAEAGEFLVDDRDILHDSKRNAHYIGYIPQGTPLINELSAEDNLKLWYSKVSINYKQALEEGFLQELGIASFLKTKVKNMSGGMKKRLSIACAIHHDPPIIIMDEPSAALDIPGKESIQHFIDRHKARGGLVLLATHDSFEMAKCDRIYRMEDGRLTELLQKGLK